MPSVARVPALVPQWRQPDSLKTAVSNRCMISTHARQPHQRAVGRAIFRKPPASNQPPVPHLRHSHDSYLSCSIRRGLLFSSSVALRAGSIRHRLDSSVHWPRLRRQAAGVFQRLAIPLRRSPLVVGQNKRQSLSQNAGGLSAGCPISRGLCEKWGRSHNPRQLNSISKITMSPPEGPRFSSGTRGSHPHIIRCHQPELSTTPPCIRSRFCSMLGRSQVVRKPCSA
jgi:hypothetical protein